jgi:hypothetical protein
LAGEAIDCVGRKPAVFCQLTRWYFLGLAVMKSSLSPDLRSTRYKKKIKTASLFLAGKAIDCVGRKPAGDVKKILCISQLFFNCSAGFFMRRVITKR